MHGLLSLFHVCDDKNACKWVIVFGWWKSLIIAPPENDDSKIKAASPSRLETRTKESIIFASSLVVN